MCSHYQAIKDAQRMAREFGVQMPDVSNPPDNADKPDKADEFDIWPGYAASFIRLHPHANAGNAAGPQLECLTGRFGLVPHWAKDGAAVRHTFNARSETAALLPSFRDAWHRGQHCIVPADAIYEPDWRSSRAVATKVKRANGQPLGIAGLWAAWQQPNGEQVWSFAMLTINASGHSLMAQFHKPADEKRMVVLLPPEKYHGWLNATPAQSMAFMTPLSAEQLVAEPAKPAQPNKANRPTGSATRQLDF